MASASSTTTTQIHIGGTAFSWQMPYKFFYKFLKTKEKDEHVLSPIFVCGNLAWRLEWLPHGQVGDVDDPDSYGLFLRLDSLPGDIESVNARFTISSPCGHYHTDEGSVFSKYNEPMSFGRGNFGKISELTEWIDAVQESRPPQMESASHSPSTHHTQRLLTVFEVSVSINGIRRTPNIGLNIHSPATGPNVAHLSHYHHVDGNVNLSSMTNSNQQQIDTAAAIYLSQLLNSSSSGVPPSGPNAAGGSEWPENPAVFHEPERAPPESLEDVDVEGIRMVLANYRLEKFLNEIIDLGVEVPSDLSFVAQSDLERIGCNTVQQRKFMKLFEDLEAKEMEAREEAKRNDDVLIDIDDMLANGNNLSR